MLACLSWSGACSPEPEGPGSQVRLDLRPLEGAPPWPAIEQVAELAFPGDWVADAPSVDEGPDGTWRLSDPAGELALGATLRGAFSLSAFDMIRIGVASAGPGEIQVELWDQGDLVGVTRPQQLVVSDAITWLQLPAHLHWFRDRRADRLVLRVHPSAHRVDLAGLELQRQPVGAALPDPAGPPALVDLWGDARRAEGLDQSRELVAEVLVPAGGRLSFSHTWEPFDGPGDETPRLVVKAVAGNASATQRFARGGGTGRDARWVSEEMNLATVAGERVELRFSISNDGGLPAACALAELTLWAPSAAPPTVLLITSDTHRADHLGAAPGSVDVATPSLDALAGRGVLFSDCLSTTNVTNPSHGALLAGLHPAETGILHNSLPLSERASTLAEAFAAAGWHTAAVVSARHLGHPSSGLGQGFDRMSWPESGGARHAHESVPLAEDWLDEAEGRPVFLWLHLFDAHGPYKPPARWRDQYWDDVDPYDPELPDPPAPLSVLPPELEGLRAFDWPAAAYRGEVSRLDEELSSLLSLRRVRDGVVALTADHGESFGEHGIWFTHAGLYPETIAVPLVLGFPGAPAGTVVDAPVGHLDLPATLLELAGVATSGVPGRSFAPLARGGSQSSAPRFALSAHGFSASVTDDGWHLVLHLREQAQRQMTSRFERHQVQLYRLAEDPGCTQDLWQQELARATVLRDGLASWLGSRSGADLAGELVEDAERTAQLRELGYLEAGGEAPAVLFEPDDCSWCQRFEEQDR